MNLNVFSPKDAVETAFSTPSMGKALLLVILASLAAVGSGFALGFTASVGEAAYAFAVSLIRFFALVVVVLVLGFMLNREKAKGKFAGLFSALSLLQVIALFATVVSLAAVPLVFSPEAVEIAAELQGAGAAEFAFKMAAFLENNPEAVNFPALAAFGAVSVVLALWGFYLLYLSARVFSGSGIIGSLLVALVSFWLMGVLPL